MFNAPRTTLPRPGPRRAARAIRHALGEAQGSARGLLSGGVAGDVHVEAHTASSRRFPGHGGGASRLQCHRHLDPTLTLDEISGYAIHAPCPASGGATRRWRRRDRALDLNRCCRGRRALDGILLRTASICRWPEGTLRASFDDWVAGQRQLPCPQPRVGWHAAPSALGEVNIWLPTRGAAPAARWTAHRIRNRGVTRSSREPSQ